MQTNFTASDVTERLIRDKVFRWELLEAVIRDKRMNRWLKEVVGQLFDLLKERSGRKRKGVDPDTFLHAYKLELTTNTTLSKHIQFSQP